jgi:predicted deacylase
MPGQKRTELVRKLHHSGEELVIPVATIEGTRPGPTFAITAGMHAGEYAGILAASRLIQGLEPDQLAGRVIIVPVVSTRAFMMRSMQLSPVDEKEIHFQVPGNPGGTYSELLIDELYRVVQGADYLIDMHAGEFAQALFPWVVVPMLGDGEMQRKAHQLAQGFDVQYLDLRADPSKVPAFCAFLAERGTVNIYAEVGKNGIPQARDVDTQYNGCLNALRAVGMLPGQKPQAFKHRYLGQTHYTVVAQQSGVWYPAIKEGEIVRKGQRLGELRDYFGNLLERYEAPFDGIVLYYWSSPAINAERRPHGYDWHSGLVRLAGLPTDEPNVAL